MSGASSPARTLMVQGTASDVGKSMLVTALCRIYARRGLRVAPFKAQNMALNAAVTIEGGEIGRAQYAQAEAAGVVPHVDMNPILLKPESLSRSQVVVLGKPIGSYHFGDYHERKMELRQVIGDALDRLRAKNDLVIIEGAGSPAEVNLRDRDLVNMWVAERAEAPVVLVTDIERGGALAAIVGTLELLEPLERARVKAFAINKFRGDPKLFTGGVRFLEERCHLPVLGVVPHMGDTGIASEDSLDVRGKQTGSAVIAVIRLPHLSNFDEFEPLARESGIALRWCEQPEEIADASLVILPGSKCTADDLAWLRRTGLAGAIVQRAKAGRPILGICGGYQMLGERILDPEGVESPNPEVPGLGLLPIVTHYVREKITKRVRMRLSEGLPLLHEAGGLEVNGYEIHHGRIAATGSPFGTIASTSEGAISGCVAGTVVHGLFENALVRRALLTSLGIASSGPTIDPYERLADHFSAALDLNRLDSLIGLPLNRI